MEKRTDLAEEAHSLWTNSCGRTTELSGVKARQWQERGHTRQRVEILSSRGARALGKPQGIYETLWTPPDSRPTPEGGELLRDILLELLKLEEQTSVLVVGLGNRAMTPDALGPRCARGLLITRHMKDFAPGLFDSFRSVSALAPGVLGVTGLESTDVVKSVVERFKPQRVIVVDALAAASPERLCRVIQITDAGIVPGSGVGNARQPLSRHTLGVPVVAIGAATVMDAGTKDTPLLVTHRDIDARIARLSGLISDGINRALFYPLSRGEIAQFVENGE